jgi:hypothetical protein
MCSGLACRRPPLLAVSAVVLITRNLSGDLTNGAQMVVQRIESPLRCSSRAPRGWNGHDALSRCVRQPHPRIVFQWTHNGRVGLTVERQQFPLASRLRSPSASPQGKTLKAARSWTCTALLRTASSTSRSAVSLSAAIAVRRGTTSGRTGHARALRCHLSFGAYG